MAGSKKRKESAQFRFHDLFSAKKARRAISQTVATRHVVEPVPEDRDVIIISDDEKVAKLRPNPAVRGHPGLSHSSTFGLPPSENKPEPCHASAVPGAYLNEPSNVTSFTEDLEARYDDWGTRDDGGFFSDGNEHDDNEIDHVKVELCQGNADEHTTVCPVCGKTMDELFLSVNGDLPLIPKLSHGPFVDRKLRDT